MNIFSKKPKITGVISYIYEFARKSKRTAIYKRQYRNIARHLSNFEKNRGIELTSENLNDALMEDFIDYLKSLNRALSTVSSIIDKTKYMLRRMQRDGYLINTSVFDISVPKEHPETVYITSEEIELIYKMKAQGTGQQAAKDLFVVGCLTGMRFSDYSQLTSKNIVGNTIQRKTLKTGEVVIVPMHRIVREIIDKNNGFPRYENSLQNFNTMIKRICKRAGLVDSVLSERTRGHKIERKKLKRYEMIGSHTARRSFATNAYLSGIMAAKIMLITGHQTEQAFFKYIRIDKKENARELAEHPFFK